MAAVTAKTALRNTTTHWQAVDREHHIHPFTDQKELAQQGSRVITKAEGTYLFDSEDNKILDAFAGLWCVNVGYGRKELADVAHKQMLELPYYNTFFKTTTPPAVELSQVLADLTQPHLNYVFFGCSGSDANDTIARFVRQYWNMVGKTSKKTIISRINGYHGSTMVAASIGGMSYMHELADLPLPGFEHIMQPYWFAEGGDLTPAEFGLKAAKALEDKILALGADKVAAFFAEPIQGAGGVIIPPETYWPEIQRICQKYDVLLVADEVICGFGRTGHWFASDYFKIKPDFMTLAKGLTSGYLPLSAVMVCDRVAKVLFDSDLSHGYTYSGHPVACAVALENIRIIREEKMVERVHDETGAVSQPAAEGAAGSSAGGRGAQPRLHRRDRDRQGQGQAQDLRARGQCRHRLPRSLHPQRPDAAGDPRYHADLALSDLDQGPYR